MQILRWVVCSVLEFQWALVVHIQRTLPVEMSLNEKCQVALSAYLKTFMVILPIECQCRHANSTFEGIKRRATFVQHKIYSQTCQQCLGSGMDLRDSKPLLRELDTGLKFCCTSLSRWSARLFRIKINSLTLLQSIALPQISVHLTKYLQNSISTVSTSEE